MGVQAHYFSAFCCRNRTSRQMGFFWGEFWWLKIFHHWVVSALSGVSLNHEEGVHTNIPS